MSITNHNIQGSIDNAYVTVTLGKRVAAPIRVKRHKTISTAHDDVNVQSVQSIKPETTKICKKANKASQNPVSQTKMKIAKEISNDLGLNN